MPSSVADNLMGQGFGSHTEVIPVPERDSNLTKQRPESVTPCLAISHAFKPEDMVLRGLH